MNYEIQQELCAMGEQKYREFSSALVTGSKPLIGIRLPILRSYAKSRVADWKNIVCDKQQDVYFEEVMLRGMLLGYGSSKDKDIEQALEMFDKFVPMVDNWSVCDSCCVSFTIFQKNKTKVWEHIQKYLYSDKEFEVRLGLIILLDHFLKTDENGKKAKRKRKVCINDLNVKEMENEQGMYIDCIIECLNRPFEQGYYAMMAAAWLTAECFVVFPSKTYKFLQSSNMDKVTYNKALQKICESKIPDEEVKKQIKFLKR